MRQETILLDHGGGGKASHRLIARHILPAFANPVLEVLDDGAVMDLAGQRIAFSTDTFVVDPIFFPGGDIGDLAVNGTVNDIAMCGAVPSFLSLALVMEEGFPMEDLEKILDSTARAAREAGVQIVTGDTKVVPRGAADKIFINTSGIGLVPEGVRVSGRNARPGDRVIVSGTIADHGMAVLLSRKGMGFSSSIKSDTASLNRMVQNMLAASAQVHVLRDPTRGGLGSTLNEVALQSRVGIRIWESAVPVRREVAAACELLGFDPLYVANEGKLVAFVGQKDAEKALAAIQADQLGKDAAIIGEVVEDPGSKVFMETAIGGARIVDMLSGEQLPRIC